MESQNYLEFDSSLADLTKQVQILKSQLLNQCSSIIDELQLLRSKHHAVFSHAQQVAELMDGSTSSLNKRLREELPEIQSVTPSVSEEECTFPDEPRRLQASVKKELVKQVSFSSDHSEKPLLSGAQNSQTHNDQSHLIGDPFQSSSQQKDTAPVTSILPEDPMFLSPSDEELSDGTPSFPKIMSTTVIIQNKRPPKSQFQRAVKKLQAFSVNNDVQMIMQDNKRKIIPASMPSTFKQKIQKRRRSILSLGADDESKAAEEEFQKKIANLASEVTLDEMLQDTLDSKLTILQDSRFMTNWNILMALSAIYMICLVPYDIAFTQKSIPWMIAVEMILEIFFILDIAIRFHVSYSDPVSKEEVTSIKKIKKHYLKTDFKWDAASSIPFTIILYPFTSEAASFFNSTKFIRIFKVTRLLKARSTLKEIEKISPNPALPRMLKILMIFFGICHYMGCLSSFVTCQTDLFEGTETFDQRCASHPSSLEKFTAGFLYAVRMMIGETNGARSLVEMQTEMIYLLIGMAVSSTLIGGLASLLGSLDATLVAKNAEMDNVREYLSRMKVSPELQRKIYRYYEYVWDIGQSAYNNQVLQGLPPRLNLELTLDFKRNLINKSPLFRIFNAKAVLQLVQKMKSIVILPEDLVLQQDEMVNDLYIVGRGTFSIFHYNSETNRSIYIQTVKPGSHFGDYELLGLRKASNISVVADGFGEMQVIQGHFFLQLLNSSPKLKRRYTQLATKAWKDQEDKIKSKKATSHRFIHMGTQDNAEFETVSLHSVLKAMKDQSTKDDSKGKISPQGSEGKIKHSLHSKMKVLPHLHMPRTQSNGLNFSGDDESKDAIHNVAKAMAAFSHHSVMTNSRRDVVPKRNQDQIHHGHENA